MTRSLHAVLVMRTAIGVALAIGAAVAGAAMLGTGRPLALVLLAGACVAILTGAAAWTFGRSVVVPLRLLATRGEAWLSGGSATLPVTYAYELDAVASAMNALHERAERAEERIAVSSAPASVEGFAAGVAATVDDSLAAITATLRAQRYADPPNAEMLALSAKLEHELLRLERVARGLRDYSRPPAAAEPPSDINAVLRGAVDLLTSRGPLRRASLRLQLAADAPFVGVARHELELLCVNLLLNAAEACSETGTVSVTTAIMPRETLEHGPPRRAGDPPLTEMRRLPHPRLRRWLDAGHRPDEVVKLVIADSGHGVAPSEEERVFEPFVRGAASAGPGLGLAVVARIAARAGGFAWVQRAREGGAAFHVILPLARSASRS